VIKTKQNQQGRSGRSFKGDPNVLSEIEIDHNSGMPRAPTAKKRPAARRSEAPEPEVEKKFLALDGRPEAKKRRRRGAESEGPAAQGPVSKIKAAKRKAAAMKADVPTEEELLADIPAVTTTQEQEHLEEYLHMFRKLRRLIRKAERDCLESNNPRGYYAVCTLYSAQREVIADIRAISDASGQVKYLDDHVLQPLTRSVGQNLLDVYYQVRKLIIETSNPKDTQFAISKHEELIKEQGRFLQASYQEYLIKTSKYLLGETK